MPANKTYFYIFILFITIYGMYSCGSKSNQIELVKNYYQIINSGDTTNIKNIIDNNFTKTNNTNTDTLVGIDVVINSIASHKRNNAEYRFYIDEIFCSNDKVCVKWNWQSLNTTKASPKNIDINGISIFYLNKNKIFKLYQSFDLQEFFNQLGS